MRQGARRLLIAGIAAALVACVALACVYWSLRHVPAFYRESLAARPQALAEDGQRFERAALALHNQLQHVGTWETRLSQDEINGWLAVDLPTKFPAGLPPSISEPRVAFDEGKVQIAVRYRQGSIDTVLWVAGEAYLTAQPNEIAVRLACARAGAVPIPLAYLVTQINQHAARANLSLRWSEARGTPVLLVRLPLERDDRKTRRVVLNHLSCVAGEIVVSGYTDDAGTREVQAATAGQPTERETRQR